MIDYFISHPEVIDEATSLAITDKQPFSWRSAWLIGSCMKMNDEKLIDRIDDIVNSLPNKGDGHQRELIKILEKMELNSEQEGKLLNHCINIWETVNKKPSVRYTAFKSILKIAKKYPELANEIEFLYNNEYLRALSPGVKHSLKKLLNDFQKKL